MTAGKKKTEDKNTDTLGSTHSMRADAEEHLARSKKSSSDLKGQTPEQLIHELQVHQIELETQTEELRESKIALEESRDKFLDLYEFAPLGYLTLNNKGLIIEVNLTGATLMGVERSKLVNAWFRKFISQNDDEQWIEYFINLLNHEEKKICTINLKRGDCSTFPARLEAVRLKGSDGAITIRIAISDISDIWQFEELRASEEKYRTLIDTLNEGIWVIDKNAITTFVNPKMAMILGYTVNDMTGRSLFSFMDEEGRRICEQNIKRLQRGIKEQHDFEFLKKDGVRIYTSLEATPIKGKNGEYLGAIAGVIDITERKVAEEALRVSEVTFRTLIEASPDAIVFSDLEGKVLMQNRMAEILVGYDDGNFKTGTNIQNFFPQEELGRLAENTQKVLEQGSIHNVEYTLIRTDGTNVLVELNSSLVQDPVGGQQRFVTVLRDITKRKRVEDALHKSEEKFRSLVEYALEGILILDLQGTILFANNATARTLEVDDCAGLIGRNVMEFIAPESREDVMRDFSNVSQGHDAYLAQYNAISAKGSKFYVESIGKIISYEGKPADLISIRDITERKQAEYKIQHALVEKEVLLREIHHRVKNNLSGILSLIELQISSLSDPVQIAPFKDLDTRIRSMALVHESLSNTKDLARINFASYTENLTSYLLPAYGTTSKVRYRIEMEDITLPIETATPCGLVMNEIVTNSLKYAFPKTFPCLEIRGEPCTITVTLHREGSDYLLGVSDNGIGMPDGIDVTISHTLGRFLIRFIVEHQLGGSLEISTAGGTAYKIRFPEPAVKERYTDEKM